MSSSDPKLSKILIVGAGLSGMITAKTLLDDGFSNVQMITKANSVGGNWAPGDEGKVYPGIVANSLYGCFHFSALRMPAVDLEDDRIQGSTAVKYYQDFFETFLKDRIVVRYGQDVTSMVRRDTGSGWTLKIRTVSTGEESEEEFDKVILCVGGMSNPYLPPNIVLSEFKGIAVHSSQVTPSVDAAINNLPSSSNKVVVVGLGKSASDLAARYASLGKDVTLVFNNPRLYYGASKLSSYVAKTRLLSFLFPAQVLRSSIERFLHLTSVGAWLRTKLLTGIEKKSNTLLGITPDSPLAGAPNMTWHGPLQAGGRASKGPLSFHSLVDSEKIQLVRGVTVTTFSEDGKSLELSDGSSIEADVVIFGTGFKSPFDFIPLETRIALGIEPIPPVNPNASANLLSPYLSLKDAPTPGSSLYQAPGSHVYRGIVPVGTLKERDLALNGFIFSVGISYIAELTSHWISSFFLEDSVLQLPTPEEAFEETEDHNIWTRARFPGKQLPFSTMKFVAHFNTDQYNDSLMEDLGLDPYRQKGGLLRLGWLLDPVEAEGLATLGEERRANRERPSS